MLSVAHSDLGNHSVNLSTIFDIATELNKAHCAEYGPSLEQLAQYNTSICDWKEELKIVVSLKTVVHLVSKNVINTSDPQDSPELLQVVSGLLQNRINKADETYSYMVSTCNLAGTQRHELKNKLTALKTEIVSLNEDILDLRHELLNKKGLVGKFRPSERNLAHAVKVSNKSLNMEVAEIEFV